ncbi:probable 28S ribosomal protein S23, mitochondrial [Oppia nitens]|uniref:probable 28S ribosomal protein S23, mitochondrial n=1 Tax=Oppia nitens TaxID=1686743 RepID=UPI0023DAFC32|nr:probable 28S ribosomal protein S23, mitochondrial [Oppia nitens]
MAGNRIHRFGTIFSRMEGLLKSGAVSKESKPIWFDVYQSFRPHIQPKLNRPVDDDQHIQDIVYPEDYIRARFYAQYGSVGLIDGLNQINRSYKSVSQKFIDNYISIAKSDDTLTDDQLFAMASDAITKDGIRLKHFETTSEDISIQRMSDKDESKRQTRDSNKQNISQIVLSDD